MSEKKDNKCSISLQFSERWTITTLLIGCIDLQIDTGYFEQKSKFLSHKDFTTFEEVVIYLQMCVCNNLPL